MNLWESPDPKVIEDIKQRWELGTLNSEHILWLLRATQRYREMLDRVTHAGRLVVGSIREDELDVFGALDLSNQVLNAGMVLDGEHSRDVDQQLGVTP